MLRKKDLVLEWAQRVTSGYPNVTIDSYKSSFSDGLAFSAILHRYYGSEKIPFASIVSNSNPESTVDFIVSTMTSLGISIRFNSKQLVGNISLLFLFSLHFLYYHQSVYFFTYRKPFVVSLF